MTSLLSTINRLSLASAAINKVALEGIEESSQGPFYKALVTRDVQSVIRDVEETEMGLFTLDRGVGSARQTQTRIPALGGDTGEKDKGKGKAMAMDVDVDPSSMMNVDRVPVVEATPLRERKRFPHAHGGGREVEEYDPEVYAEAALRFLARYQSVAHMPRAQTVANQLLKRAEETRNAIEELQVKLQKSTEESTISPKKQVMLEEKKIRELQVQVQELRRRKEALLEERERDEGTQSSLSPSVVTPRSRQRTRVPSSPFSPRIIPVPTNQALPRQTARRMSRLPVGPLMSKGRLRGEGGRESIAAVAAPVEEQEQEEDEPEDGVLQEQVEVEGEEESYGYEERVYQGEQVDRTGRDDQIEEGEEGEDRTVLAHTLDQKAPDLEGDASGELTTLAERDEDLDVNADVEGTPSISRTRRVGPLFEDVDQTPMKEFTPRAAIGDLGEVQTPMTPTTNVYSHAHKRAGSRSGIKVTPEVELISVKIWSTMGETLFPGHLNPEGAGNPRGRETITLLQRILTLPAAPPSPSNLSTLASVDSEVINGTSTPTQVLSVHLILSLLGAPSMGLGDLASSTSGSLSGSTSTKYAMPLQKLKEVVSEKLKTGTGDGGIGTGLGEKDVTRALYGCVAKKLMAIDRGGGGQVVRFNL